MDLEVFVTDGLGDNSYLLSSGGEAVLVDPQRDVDRFLRLARARRLRILYVVETHVHNDYVSGAVEVARRTGAEVAAPAKGRYAFPHRRLAEGDELRLGDVRLIAMETPGHTPEHMSYLVYEDGSDIPAGVFTGGSLMVGGAGRTDLLGPQLTDELTRAQFKALRRLGSLPDEARVLPTHGAGSFCATGETGRERTSTIGQERTRNRALLAPDEHSFVASHLAETSPYPRYYGEMARINREGPKTLGGLPRIAALTPTEVARRIEEGAWVIDARDRRSFAASHLPASLNVELFPDFGTYVGWVVPFNHPLVLVLPEPEAASSEEAAVQLVRIGYERLEGYLGGGVEAWRSDGRPTRSYPVATIEELSDAQARGEDPPVLDVRLPAEWDAGHIPGSVHVTVGELPRRLDEVPADDEVWAVCAAGHRASLAASVLDAAGRRVRLVGEGGVPAWLAMRGSSRGSRREAEAR